MPEPSSGQAELLLCDFRLILIVVFSRSRDMIHVLVYKTSVLDNLPLFLWLTEDDKRFLISLVFGVVLVCVCWALLVFFSAILRVKQSKSNSLPPPC